MSLSNHIIDNKQILKEIYSFYDMYICDFNLNFIHTEGCWHLPNESKREIRDSGEKRDMLKQI